MLDAQDLHLTHHELVEIGDAVSICRWVRLTAALSRLASFPHAAACFRLCIVDPWLCAALCVYVYGSAVSLLPSAALGAAKISIMGGADVTNQTALYPGVTVKPGAVLGVFTYAEAGRTFPRHSITQVNL